MDDADKHGHPVEPEIRVLPKKRWSWVGAPEMFELNQACRVIVDAYGHCVYLVGSATQRRDFRDVDVRCILGDKDFDAKYPDIGSNHQLDARWSLDCSAISLFLSKHTGLKIDFQFQRQTEANEEFGKRDHTRIPLGFFVRMAKSEK